MCIRDSPHSNSGICISTVTRLHLHSRLRHLYTYCTARRLHLHDSQDIYTPTTQYLHDTYTPSTSTCIAAILNALLYNVVVGQSCGCFIVAPHACIWPVSYLYKICIKPVSYLHGSVSGAHHNQLWAMVKAPSRSPTFSANGFTARLDNENSDFYVDETMTKAQL